MNEPKTKLKTKPKKALKKALMMRNICVRNVLKDLNLEVNDGEFVIVMGENGAGKTTLFNTISGSIRPSRGSIFIDENDVTKQDMCERAALVANVFQDPKVGTIASMSIRDNLSMAYMRGRRRALIESCNSPELDGIFTKELREIGLEGRLDDLCGELSGGQRQALSIIMALLSDSKIILLDEITAALDSANSEKILDIIEWRVVSAQKTCLMITHNADHLKRFEGAKVLLLKAASPQS